MGRSMKRPDLESVGQSKPLPNGSVVRSFVRDGALWQSAEWQGLRSEHQAAWQIGSGSHARGYLVRIGDALFQSPVAEYLRRKIWDVAPGYERLDRIDFNRPVTAECLNCHSGKPLPIVDSINRYAQPEFAVASIDCQRCHGDGEVHQRQPARTNIVNPVRLGTVQRDSICEQCHLQGEARISQPGARPFQPGQKLEDSVSVFVAGRIKEEQKVVSHVEQLALSRCAQKSSQLWCGTCHKAHGEVMDIGTQCSSCHAAKLSERHPKSTESCESCHMPKRIAVDGLHAAFTDHRIRKPGTPMPAGKSETEVLRPWRANSDSALNQRNLGLALVARTDAPSIQKGFQLLAGVYPKFPRDPEMLAAMGMVLFLKDQYADAAKLLETGIAIRPRYVLYYERLAIVHRAMGRTDLAIRALEKSIELEPAREDAYHRLAELMPTVEARREALERYLRVNPQSLTTREALGRR